MLPNAIEDPVAAASLISENKNILTVTGDDHELIWAVENLIEAAGDRLRELATITDKRELRNAITLALRRLELKRARHSIPEVHYLLHNKTLGGRGYTRKREPRAGKH